ncbi:MAG: hypothetical protein HZA50_18745 [Planctomycetes bacterium]|nr:hypothetical protein [Planctomycetota bacterium]
MKCSCARLLFPAAIILLACATPSRACSIPVFRYAMEHWPPQSYEIVVFRRGPLMGDEAKVLAALRDYGDDGRGEANFVIRDVDLAGKPDEQDVKLWSTQGSAALPRVVVCTPANSPERSALWAGGLDPQTVKNLIDSPVRREIVRRLASGESAVWILIEQGKKDLDDALAGEINKELAWQKQNLELSEEARQASSPDGPELKIAFSLVRLSRIDPAEAAFVNMLLGLLSEGKRADEAAAIPIFGRGRALTALIGKDITASNIRKYADFMTSDCSCTVKEQNPGVDLLISANWNQICSTGKPADPNLLSLAGLSQFAPVAATGPAKTAGQSAEQTGGENDQSIYLNILIIVGAGVAVIAAMTIVLARRRKPGV